MTSTLVILFLSAAPTLITPCVDEVTVRAEPSLKSARVGVIPRAAQVELLSVSKKPERMTLTVDKNVPAPFSFSPEDFWLEVRALSDGGELHGFVFGGLMCRRALVSKQKWLSFVGWSASNDRVAFIEYATDSFACGWGRPATFRIVDPESGATLDSIADDCPAAELMLSKRAAIEELLKKHSIAATWNDFEVFEPGSLRASVSSWTKEGRCTLRVLEQEGTPARSADGEVTIPAGASPTVSVVAWLQQRSRQLVFVRVQSSEEEHHFAVLRLAPLETWRDVLVKGVHVTTKPRGNCVGLEGTPENSAAKKALAKLNTELARRMRKSYREQYGGSDDAGFCLVSAGMRNGKVELELIAPSCIGNECPGEACMNSRVFEVAGGAIVSESSRNFGDYSCDP